MEASGMPAPPPPLEEHRTRTPRSQNYNLTFLCQNPVKYIVEISRQSVVVLLFSLNFIILNWKSDSCTC